MFMDPWCMQNVVAREKREDSRKPGADPSRDVLKKYPETIMTVCCCFKGGYYEPAIKQRLLVMGHEPPDPAEGHGES